MQRLTSPNAKLRAWARRVSMVGTCCGVFAMLVFVTGCPVTPNPCTGFDADDGDACTVDTCEAVDGVATAVNTPVDCGNQLCDPATGDCVDCLDDADCDDGDFCNGAETCDAGTCADGTEPCDAATEVCDEAIDECLTACSDDADCDDGAFCNGAEACVDGGCEAGDAPCPDDGVFCNGTESCDEDTDACVSSGDPCDAGEICNEDTNACDATPCTDDTDCDDALFCNGAETCNTTTGSCEAGTDPCTAEQTCDDTTDTCVDPSGTTFTLTASTTEFDSIVGTAGNDTVIGAPNTLQTGDVIDLKGGTGDTVDVTLAGTAATPVIANTEIINLSLLADTNITSSGINASPDGTTLTSSADSGITLTLTAFKEANGLGMTGQGNLTIASLASNDTLDVVNLAISGTVGTFTDTSSHINQLNIAATGSKVTLGAGTLDSSSSTEKATWTDDADLTVEDTQVDNQFTAKFIDATGVVGTCTLELDADTTAGGAEALDMTNISGVDRVLFSQDQSTNGFTFTGTPATFIIEVVDNNANRHFAGALTVDNNSLTSATDTLTLKLGGDGDATGIGGAFSAVGYEIVNVEVSSTGSTTGTYVFASTVALDTGTVDRIETVNVSGDQNVTFTGALTLDVLDCSNVTKTVTVTAGAANAGTIMRGGSAADTLDQTANVSTIVQGNAGGDTIDCDNGTARQDVRYVELSDGAGAGASSGFDAVTGIDMAAGDTTDDIIVIAGNLRTALDDGTGGNANNGSLNFQSSTGAAANDAVATTVEALFVREAEFIATFTTAADIATGLNARFDLSAHATAGDDLFFVINTAAATETFSWGVWTESGTGSEAQASEIVILGSGTMTDATNLTTADFVLK